MSMNWLEGVDHPADGSGRPQAMPVFAGQKLVAVGGSSGMGRQTAADVVAAGGSATNHPGPPVRRPRPPGARGPGPRPV